MASVDLKKKVDDEYERLRRLFSLTNVPDVDVETLQQWLAEDEGKRVVLVDVRSAEECEVSTLPGALWQEEFERDAALYEGRRVVPFCTIGARSGTYTKKLRERGVEAYNLKGSVLAWTHRDLPLVVRSAQPPGSRPQAPSGEALGEERETRRVHVWGKDFAMAKDGYEQVWFDKSTYIKRLTAGVFKFVFGR